MNIKIQYNGFESIIPKENSIAYVIELQKNRWRQKRKDIFSELDIQFIRAIEEDDDAKKQEVISQKNILRNITEIEMPNTLDEILNFWPDILKD